MKQTLIRGAAILLAFAISISALWGDESINLNNESEPFQQPFVLNPVADGILGGTGVALSGSALLCDKVFHIKPNNTTKFPLNQNDINGFDRPFIQNYSETLDYVGDGILALTLATPAIMFTNSNSDWLTIGVMYAETIAIANGLKEWGKLLINRPRPYMYFDNYPEDEVTGGDWHNSMPSGHTTMAFAGAAFTSAIFNEYFPTSGWRHVVTAASFGLATTVGIVRMCSGNHFLTDVLTGAAIGTLTGFMVPFFHSQTFYNLINKNKNVDVAASPLGFAVAIKF